MIVTFQDLFDSICFLGLFLLVLYIKCQEVRMQQVIIINTIRKALLCTFHIFHQVLLLIMLLKFMFCLFILASDGIWLRKSVLYSPPQSDYFISYPRTLLTSQVHFQIASIMFSLNIPFLHKMHLHVYEGICELTTFIIY